MGAAPGNKNAVGANGGFSYPKEYREDQVKLRGLVLSKALVWIQTGTKEEQMEVMRRILPTIFPREVTGEGGGPIRVATIPSELIAKHDLSSSSVENSK